MSTFESLLQRDNPVTIHGRNLQLLATEMYKLRNGLSPKIMEDLFPLREINYNIEGVMSLNHRMSIPFTTVKRRYHLGAQKRGH